MADEKLTEKQKRFCDYFIETGNSAESAIRAGYSKNSAKEIGSENLTKPKIKRFISDRLASKDNKRIASQEEVLEYYTRLMRGEELDEVVIMNPGKGFERTEQRVDNRTRLLGAKELAKRFGIDRPDGTGDKDIKIDINITTEDDEDSED